MELLLNPEKKRYTLFPIKYHDIWDFYKVQESSYWRVEEVDLSKDNWDSLTENEKFFIKHILAFFAASDGIVSENLAENFNREVQIPEAKFYYSLQTAMENIHSLAYSLMIDTYIKDEQEKHQLFNAIENLPAVQKKAQWALKWIKSPNFIERLVAFICVEGIFFSSSFASIFWLREQKKLPGLCTFNSWISRKQSDSRE
jgi:ribonucleoside-diphosphate reductase beta chain